VRTYEELLAALDEHIASNHVPSLNTVADEFLALGTKQATAMSYKSRGIAYWLTSDYEEALKAYRIAVDQFSDLGDESQLATVLSNIGNVYADTADYVSALENYRRSLSINERDGDLFGIARNCGNIGTVYHETYHYSEALEYLQRALEASYQIGDAILIGSNLVNIGNVYSATGDGNEARTYLERALEIFEGADNKYRMAIAYGCLGSSYAREGNTERFFEYTQRAADLHKEIGNRRGAALWIGNLLSKLLEQERYDEIPALLDEQEELGLDDARIHSLHLGFRSNMLQIAGDDEGARRLLHQAVEIASTAGLTLREAEFHQALRDIAQKMNDFEGYVKHNNEYLRLKSEVETRDAVERLSMMKAERKIAGELRERDKERALLYGALPESVANRMLRGEDVSGDHFANASVLFLDIVGFTKISDRIPPGHVVHLLKAIFKICDDVCQKHGLTKIKTIGDSYMAVAGVPEPLDDHAQRAAQTALEMLKGLNQLELTMDPSLGDTSWTKDIGDIKIRIGLHCGPLVAGIVGDQRLQYDVWGDTVNVASRMESSSEPGRIQVSQAFADALHAHEESDDSRGELDHGSLRSALRYRGETEIKGKGAMKTYWLDTSQGQ